MFLSKCNFHLKILNRHHIKIWSCFYVEIWRHFNHKIKHFSTLIQRWKATLIQRWFNVSVPAGKAYFLIQLNADSLYPFACWSLCLLCFLILMLILIESRSMLILYWLGDRMLTNAYLTKKKNSIQNINLPKEFLKI